MSDKLCPTCKLSLHPAMANRYGGYCSQSCEAVADVDKLRSENERLKSQNEQLILDRDIAKSEVIRENEELTKRVKELEELLENKPSFDSIEEQEFHLDMIQDRELARMDREIHEMNKRQDKEE